MKRKNLKSLKFSVIILIIIWSVKIFEIVFDYDFTEYGVLPRNFSGLIGILFSPLIHSDVNHLLSNSLPVIILCLLIFNFYSQIAKNIHISLLYFRLMALVHWKRILSHRCKWFNLRHGKLFIFQWDFKKKLSIKCGRIVSNFHLRWTILGSFPNKSKRIMGRSFNWLYCWNFSLHLFAEKMDPKEKNIIGKLRRTWKLMIMNQIII